MQARPELVERHGTRIAETMAFILSGAMRVTMGLRENAAITLGRVAWVAPAAVSPHLGHFLTSWCGALRNIRDDIEKEHAFVGLCRVIRQNLGAGAAAFPAVAAAIVSWRHVADQGLQQDMVQLVQTFKEAATASGQWQQMMGQLEPAVRDKLISMCGV